jgi:secreted trypsin-like serine protease
LRTFWKGPSDGMKRCAERGSWLWLMSTSLAWPSAILIAACQQLASEPTGCSAQAIYAGSRDAAAGLDDAAVAAVVIEEDSGSPSLCSGALMGPRFVMTAAHCARGAEPGQIRVSFGPTVAPFAIPDPCTLPATTYSVVALWRDPGADVMLLELASAVPLTPVAMTTTSPAAGQAGLVAGYGLTEEGTAGSKLYAGTTVIAVGRDFPGYSFPGDAAPEAAVCVDAGADATACSDGPLLISVDSGADAGSCAGDSGGPLFVKNASGWQLAGVLSEGSESCTGVDVYVDLASVVPWINAVVGM